MIHPGRVQREFEVRGVVKWPGFLSGARFSELETELARFHREVVPRMPGFSLFDFHRAQDAITEGRRATEAALDHGAHLLTNR